MFAFKTLIPVGHWSSGRKRPGLVLRESMLSSAMTALVVVAGGLALAGCVTGSDSGTATPSPALSASVDPMDPLFAPPPSGGAANGSQRVPLGQLAPNTAADGSQRVPLGQLASNATPSPATMASASNASTKSPPLLIAPGATPAAQPKPVTPAAPAAPTAPSAATSSPAKAPLLEYRPLYTQPASQTQGKQPTTEATKAAPKPEPVKAEPMKPEAAKSELAKAEPAKPTPLPEKVVADTPKLKLPNVTARPDPRYPGEDLRDEETVVISSETPEPKQSREFIPASPFAPDMPAVETTAAPGSMVDRPMSAAERNIVQRFEVLKRLLDEGLITPEEFARHRTANIGALLPFTRDPAALGLERPSASSDAVVARLQALRRALEMHAITPQQHASERLMILAALLPTHPDERGPSLSPPSDVIQGASIVSRLQNIKGRGLISSEEFDAEKRAIDQYLRTGSFGSSSNAAVSQMRGEKGSDAKADKSAANSKKPEAAGAKTAAASPDGASALTEEVTGPVLHLASFRSIDAANRAWQEAMALNKPILSAYKQIVRKVDLGEGKGVFYRLMVGPFTSLSQAETTCIKLKANNQFCRASADGS